MSGVAPTMFADEIPSDAELVRRLLQAQFPEWAGLPIERVELVGTDNALYRLGDDLVVRLPRRHRPAETLEKECEWLPRLGPLLPLPVPVPVARGAAGEVYPLPWAVYRWVPGERATPERIGDQRRFATDLVQFIAGLQRIDPANGPPPGMHNFGRGEPLLARDEQTRAAIRSLGSAIDVAQVTAVWEDALDAPVWQGPPLWIHGDLDRQNLLVLDGRLSGVVDFGALGVGDPACDVMVVWKVLARNDRELFRQALAVDEPTWMRARGWVVSQAVRALDYYTLDTHPVLVREARLWLAGVLAA